MRRLSALLVLVLIAGCTTGNPQPDPNPTQTPVTPASTSANPVIIGMSYIPNIQFAPFYVAQTQGLFANVSAPVELRHHGTDEGLFTAIATNQEQFVIAAGDEALQARDEGIDLVAVGSYYVHYPVRIIMKSTSKDLQYPASLKGKRIGIPGRYGESWFGLLVALKEAGLSESDVEIMEIGYTANAALATDKVDAVVGFSNNDFVQFQLAGMDVTEWQLTTSGEEPPLVGASILTSRAFLEAAPELTKQVVEAIVAGMSVTADDPARAVEISSKYVPELTEPESAKAARATLDATLKVMGLPCVEDVPCEPGVLELAKWQEMADFLLEVGVLSKPAEVADAAVNVLDVLE